MLSIGLIGNINLMDHYLKQIRDNSQIHIVGKSTAGLKIEPNDYTFSILEFNRIELIERSDILLVNQFSLLPFNLICKTIKKTKHIFASDYPEFSFDECKELVKLISEAKIIFQVTNPLFQLPGIQWLDNNIKSPSFWDISLFRSNSSNTDMLIQILLMLNRILGTSPKKVAVVSFHSPSAQSEFYNLRLDFGNATVVNLNFGKQPSDEFIIKTYSSDKVTSLNFRTQTFNSNNSSINLNNLKYSDEFDQFIENILSKKYPVTTIDNYLSVLKTFRHIKAKLSQFSDI